MDSKKLKKQREATSKLSRPQPMEHPSGKRRCQVMINGKRIDVIEYDPAVAHAKALAVKAGLMEEAELRGEERKGAITLEKAIDRYADDRLNVLSPSTVNGYQEIQRDRFKGLMQKRVTDIQSADLQAAVNVDAEVVSAKTIRMRSASSLPSFQDVRRSTQSGSSSPRESVQSIAAQAVFT